VNLVGFIIKIRDQIATKRGYFDGSKKKITLKQSTLGYTVHYDDWDWRPPAFPVHLIFTIMLFFRWQSVQQFNASNFIWTYDRGFIKQISIPFYPTEHNGTKLSVCGRVSGLSSMWSKTVTDGAVQTRLSWRSDHRESSHDNGLTALHSENFQPH
jgi:hypothetical protein